MPEITIITVNFNNRNGLINTIESVVSQTIKNFEFIVIDGGSTDGSIAILEEYNDSINFWNSESDCGIYNAMNKGILHASGEYLLMLNSGDTLNNQLVLQKVTESKQDVDLIYGDILWIENKDTFISEYPEELYFSYFLKHSLGHQATFIKRSLHSWIGMYDENYRIVSDWIFFTKAICKFNVSYKHVPFVISNCTRDGISCDPNNQGTIVKERLSFLEAEFPHFLIDYKELEYYLQKLKEYESMPFINKLFRLNKLMNKILKR